MPVLSLLAALALAAAPASSASANPGSVLMAQNAPTSTAPLPNTSVQPRLFHVFATPDGESHFEELKIAANAGPLPLSSLSALSYNPTNVTWHHAPTPQFAINLSGDLQVETSDGQKHQIGPGDLVYLDDTQGKGHITRLLGPVTCMFIRPQPGFDVIAWARGGAKAP